MFKSKKNRNYPSFIKYTVISILILAIALLIGAMTDVLLSPQYKGTASIEHVIGMVEGIIGAIATGLVLYQLKVGEKTESHQSDIEEATFLLQYNQTFIQDANMLEVERLLEDQAYYDQKAREIISSENRQKFINYLVYL